MKIEFHSSDFYWKPCWIYHKWRSLERAKYFGYDWVLEAAFLWIEITITGKIIKD